MTDSLMAGPETALPQRRKRRRSSEWNGLLFVLPALLLVIVFFIIPLGMAAWMSLHKWPLMGVPRWVGFANYEKLLGDKSFWSSLWFTIEYTLVITVGLLGTSMALALIVQGQGKAISAYRTIYFLPVVTGFASAALLWVWLSNVDTGLFSPLAQDIGLTEGRINILANFTPAFWSVIAMVIWKMAGFYMVILMSGLQAIPTDYIEAARIDGAKWDSVSAIS